MPTKLYVVQSEMRPAGAHFACHYHDIISPMIALPNVTLIGIDGVDIERALRAADISTTGISFGAVKLLSSLPSTDPRVIAIPPVTSIEAYSKFCLTELYKYVDTSHALIFQYDGFVLNPAAWKDEWLLYDYIGAPIEIGQWTVERHGVPVSSIGDLVVGNGGFSLRSRRLLELTASLAAAGDFILTEPEDWAQCYTERAKLEAVGMRFAPVPVAEAFSFEGRSPEYYQYVDAFGFHGLRWTDISRWLALHPQYQEYFPRAVTPATFQNYTT